MPTMVEGHFSRKRDPLRGWQGSACYVFLAYVAKTILWTDMGLCTPSVSEFKGYYADWPVGPYYINRIHLRSTAVLFLNSEMHSWCLRHVRTFCIFRPHVGTLCTMLYMLRPEYISRICALRPVSVLCWLDFQWGGYRIKCTLLKSCYLKKALWWMNALNLQNSGNFGFQDWGRTENSLYARAIEMTLGLMATTRRSGFPLFQNH